MSQLCRNAMTKTIDIKELDEISYAEFSAGSRFRVEPPQLARAHAPTLPSSPVSWTNRMDQKQTLLHHFLAALAYRTQKALRGAPAEFASFRAAPKVRTPHELIRHMDDVLGYSRTFFTGGSYRAPEFAEFAAAIAHFHETLADVARHIELGTRLRELTPEILLQGPFSDAMTHAGQLALLRRLAGSAVPPENFIFADINDANLGPDQPLPARPDEDWPERP